MNNAERYKFSDFTLDNFRGLLRLAKESYTPRSFTDFSRTERFVLWRHDVDFSIHAALKLATIERQEDVRATYFVHFHNEFYNLLEREVTVRLLEILSMGHGVGLHFDSHFYEIGSEASLDIYLTREKRILEELVGQPVRVFSFHRPSPFTLEFRKWEYSGMINTYAEFFRKEVGYCSDSNGYWRHRRLEDVLRERADERLQVLTHPAWWQETAMSPRERIERCITGRADGTRKIYSAILAASGRPDLDW